MNCWNCGRPVSTVRPRPIGTCDGMPHLYLLAGEYRCRSDRYVLHETDVRYATAHDGRPR